MKKRKPLTDESGEVRELLMEDIRRFRPMAEGLSPSLAAKLGIKIPPAPPAPTEEAEFTSAGRITSKRRRSGIPTGNAGEYFVMGELLRQGFDAQLADRNTKGYDLLVGREDEPELRKIQVKTVRSQPWYINVRDFTGDFLDRVTIYVLLGPPRGRKPVRFFIARNRDLVSHIHRPAGWKEHGFMNIKALEKYEDQWQLLRETNSSPQSSPRKRGEDAEQIMRG
jgi:hypothetical protein